MMVPPDVGRAFKNHLFSEAAGSDATMVQLTFFHDAQLFTHGACGLSSSAAAYLIDPLLVT